MSRSAGRPAN